MPARVPTSIPGIYAITRIETGRQYIGQARNIRKRWELHRHYLRDGKHHNFILQQAWTKYGAKAFSFTIIRDLSAVTKDDLAAALNQAEIEEINAATWPFNLTEGADGGLVPTASTRALLSTQRKAMWQREGFREKRSQATKQLYENLEWKTARDAAVKAGQNAPDVVARRSAQFTEMWKSPEHRATQSEKRKANWQDPAYRAKQIASRKASWADKERLEKTAVSIELSWADPAKRANRLAGMKTAIAKRKAAKAQPKLL